MRILIIHNQLWAHYKSILFEEIHRELSLQYAGSSFLVAQIAQYEASRANMQGTADNPDFNYPYQVLYPGSLDDVSLGQRIRGVFKVFRTFRPDVLTITGYYDWAQILLLLYAKIQGTPVIISVESSQMDRARASSKELIKQLIFKCTDGFFCFGTSSVRYLLSLGVPIAKIAVRQAAVVDNIRIRQRFDRARLSRTLGQPLPYHFIFVGRLAPEKNLFLLLEAFRKCVDSGQMSDWGMVFVGDGPERVPLQASVLANGLASRVSFTGGVGWQAVPDHLAQADVLVLPSLSEPWGLVVNEALVCGMPVIVSRQCGCAEDLVRHQENGFLFDPQDSQALADAMLFYARNPNEIRLHGLAGEQIIAPFSPSTVAREMVAYYHSLRP